MKPVARALSFLQLKPQQQIEDGERSDICKILPPRYRYFITTFFFEDICLIKDTYFFKNDGAYAYFDPISSYLLETLFAVSQCRIINNGSELIIGECQGDLIVSLSLPDMVFIRDNDNKSTIVGDDIFKFLNNFVKVAL